jgi:hypothetical protein
MGLEQWLGVVQPIVEQREAGFQQAWVLNGAGKIGWSGLGHRLQPLTEVVLSANYLHIVLITIAGKFAGDRQPLINL